jgi:L-alanine-DL-glutamate epimerase-like enolase superfamily enzyme
VGGAVIPVESLDLRAYRIPTDAPESDGTIEWRSTTLVVVEARAGGRTGLGYTYASAGTGIVISEALADVVIGADAFDIPRIWTAMVAAVRNIGRRGVAACAISAVDAALWDLKARLLDLPLVRLFGAEREAVAIYGSGGFTSYDDRRLADQLAAWVAREGCAAVKMKIGREPARDLHRMRAAREAIGAAELYIDANGALTPKAALRVAEDCDGLGVTWFEEPVSSDDLAGLRLLREQGPVGMNITAGEYGYEPIYFRRMLEAGAVDVMQADATRCCGLTGFLRAAALADAHGVPVSAHTAPSLHLHVACAAPRMMNIEWFHDHVRIERMLFDGAPEPLRGQIRPDLSRPGHGLCFKDADAERFAL